MKNNKTIIADAQLQNAKHPINIITNPTDFKGLDTSSWEYCVFMAIAKGIASSEEQANQICHNHQPHAGYGCLSDVCPLRYDCPAGIKD